MSTQIMSVGDLEDVARFCEEEGTDPMTYLASDVDALLDEADELLAEMEPSAAFRRKRGA